MQPKCASEQTLQVVHGRTKGSLFFRADNITRSVDGIRSRQQLRFDLSCRLRDGSGSSHITHAAAAKPTKHTVTSYELGLYRSGCGVASGFRAWVSAGTLHPHGLTGSTLRYGLKYRLWIGLLSFACPHLSRHLAVRLFLATVRVVPGILDLYCLRA